jgi:hypothetical protein
MGASRAKIVAMLFPLELAFAALEAFLLLLLSSCAFPRAERHALIPASCECPRWRGVMINIAREVFHRGVVMAGGSY